MDNTPLERCLQQSQSQLLHCKAGNPSVVTAGRHSVMPEIWVCHSIWCLLLEFRQLHSKGADFACFPTEYAMLPVSHATSLPKSFCTLSKDPLPLKQLISQGYTSKTHP